MRSKNPDLMVSIKEFIHEYFANHYTTPSTAKIAENLNIGRSTAYKYLLAMDELGMISYKGGIITDEELELLVKDRENVPIVGQVPPAVNLLKNWKTSSAWSVSPLLFLAKALTISFMPPVILW